MKPARVQWFAERIASDARHFQIAFLSVFVIVGVYWFQFDVRPLYALAMLGTAQLVQAVCTRLTGAPFDPRSPLISGLSLCLLFRTNSIVHAVAAAGIAIASKYLVRWNGKHVFNPTNIAIVGLVLLTPSAWVSSGQWGSEAWIAFLLAALGGMVCYRAARSDIALAVLVFHAAVLFGRALWLGDPLSIPLHQMQNGTLLVFAFFMISDPKTTPNSRLGRFVYAGLVVAFAAWVQFGLFRPNGLLYGLALLSPIVPVLDALVPGRRFEWHQPADRKVRSSKGDRYEQHLPSGAGLPVPGTAH